MHKKILPQVKNEAIQHKYETQSTTIIDLDPPKITTELEAVAQPLLPWQWIQENPWPQWLKS